jgi:hypothetical protein
MPVAVPVLLTTLIILPTELETHVVHEIVYESPYGILNTVAPMSENIGPNLDGN